MMKNERTEKQQSPKSNEKPFL